MTTGTRIALAVAAALAPWGIAAAGDYGKAPQAPSTNVYQNVNDNWNTTTNNAGGAGGNASVVNNIEWPAGAGAGQTLGSAGAPAPAATGNSVVVTAPRQRQFAPATGFAYGAAPCVNGGGVWGSGPGFSVGGSLSRVDKDCHDLNVAQFLCGGMGRCDLALALLIQQPRVLQAVEIANASPSAVPVAAPVPAPAPPVVAMRPIVSPGDPGYRAPRRARPRPARTSCPTCIPSR